MRRVRPVDGERRRGGEAGRKEGGGNTYVAFDFCSGFVLRVRVDVGGDFVAVGDRSCAMLVVREERG